uniref:Calexcitin 1 isoform X1 n=1 Tax=Sogatella furcifera TaxID=113103 RepID=A0A2S1TNT2_SOGFU|nr:calexcitin 1 isoform X1 [Sogatella furcifera]
MPISPFRMKKLMYVFNVFFDVNKSGQIDRKDFELAIERICKMRGWSEGDAQYADTKKILLQVWEGLKQRADHDHDGQVSHEEWCSMWDEYAKNPEKALEWQLSYMDFMFDMEDTSGDGAIDEEEFASVCVSYGIPEEECRTAFRKFSAPGESLTKEKFAVLWKEFFCTDDPNAPGNFVFGKAVFD